MNSSSDASANRLPTVYLPHGGGPCFFMEWTLGPRDTWDRLALFLRTLPERYPKARSLLVISAHWEERLLTVQNGERPPLFFDYHGFPPHTYELTWPAPGSPDCASRVRALLTMAGFDSKVDAARGFDHGVFVPLKVAYPYPTLPTLQLSLDETLDARTHLAIGRALTPLRDEGVLIIGSGMSFHNMSAFMNPGAVHPSSRIFDDWLRETCEAEPARREERLSRWMTASAAREAHPREEHLLPLMVVAGAAVGGVGRRIFRDVVMGAQISAFEFV